MAKSRPERYTFFGGSFDPPHLGHLRLAREARDRFALNGVLLAPVGHQPLKTAAPTGFAHRLAMVERLVGTERGLSATAVDAPREGPNYTVETLPILRAMLPAGAELYLLAGADSALTLQQWHNPTALLTPPAQGGVLDGWILAARPGFPLEALQQCLPAGFRLTQGEPQSGLRTFQVHPPHGAGSLPMHVLTDANDPASSTEIRAQLSAGQPSQYLSEPVMEYIRAHRLYSVLR